MLKLILAIGATSFDETFSLRPSATQWVYEAQTWLSAPEFKSRLHLQFVQTHLLLLLGARSVRSSRECNMDLVRHVA